MQKQNGCSEILLSMTPCLVSFNIGRMKRAAMLIISTDDLCQGQFLDREERHLAYRSHRTIKLQCYTLR